MSFFQNEIILSFKKSCIKYGRNLVDIATRAILLVICTAILNIIVLYFYNILWHLYRLTYIGRQFVKLQPQQTQMITAIISRDIASLSLNTTLTAFVICMVVSAGCQVFYVSRFFYQSRGKIGKLLLWGLPLTALVSMYANNHHGLDSWMSVIPISIVPTLCVFTYCFKFSQGLLPEMGDVMGMLLRCCKKLLYLMFCQAG
jgi:hypothetical protein